MQELLVQSFDLLTEKQRYAFQRYFVDGLNMYQITEEMGSYHQAVSCLLHQGYKKIAKYHNLPEDLTYHTKHYKK